MLVEKETIGKFLSVAGATLFFIGLLFLGGDPTDQLICATGWLLGSVLFVTGLILAFELFTYSTRNGKLGVFLMAVSVVLVITALILYSLKEFTFRFTGTQAFSRGTLVPNLFIREVHPYAWVAILLVEAAVLLFVSGLLLKLFDAIF